MVEVTARLWPQRWLHPATPIVRPITFATASLLFTTLSLSIGIGAGGSWLVALGGSWYYLLAGIGLVVSGALLLAAEPAGVWLYLVVLACTWIWGLEVGFNGWALVPRVVAPTLLGLLALLCLPVLLRGRPSSRSRRARVAGPSRGPTAAVVLALTITIVLALSGKVTTAQEQPAPTGTPARNQQLALSSPASLNPQEAAPGRDWPTYGGSNRALRFSPLAQINRDNVKDLKQVWMYRTGDLPHQEQVFAGDDTYQGRRQLRGGRRSNRHCRSP
jgi:quinoprotein glucose dehydrogenase